MDVIINKDLSDLTLEQAFLQGVERGKQLAGLDLQSEQVHKVLRQAAEISVYRYCMSYDSSYFGEPSGWLKQRVAEIDRNLPAELRPAQAKVAQETSSA